MGLRLSIVALIALLGAVCSVPAQAWSAEDWAVAREVNGNFGIFLTKTGPVSKSEVLMRTGLEGFLLQGTVQLKREKTTADSILFRGKATGLMFMRHNAAIGDGQIAASEQLCADAFERGEFMLEIFPREQEYQVGFSGSVPACLSTTSYPLFKRMAEIFGTMHEVYRDQGDYWAPLAAELKRARDDFASVSAAEKNRGEVTFSAGAVPDWRKDPTGRFPVMHFYPLPPGNGTKLAGTGKVQLDLSTSMFPTTLQTEASWALERK